MKKILFILILLPFVNFSQIDVVQGPKWHQIDSVLIDYNISPSKVFIREKNYKYRDIKRIFIEELNQDTLAINMFFIDCFAHYPSSKINDTILDVPQTMNNPFNLIVRTYKDTSGGFPECYERDFYTLMDSVFIPIGENSYSTLSVEELSQDEKEIKVYPNPAKDELFIKQGASFKHSNFEIINSRGKLMMKGKVGEFIDVSSLDQGIYFIRFRKNEGAVIKRFVVN